MQSSWHRFQVMCVFIVWVFFHVWTGVSKSVLGQILCLFLIVKRDSENSLSFMGWFNSNTSSRKTLCWSCHSCVDSWSSTGLKWILAHCLFEGGFRTWIQFRTIWMRVIWAFVFLVILGTSLWYSLWQRSALTPRLKEKWFRNQTTPFTHSSKLYLYKRILLKDIKFSKKLCTVCMCVWEVDLKSMTMETVPSYSQGSAKDDGKRKKKAKDGKWKNGEQSQDYNCMKCT